MNMMLITWVQGITYVYTWLLVCGHVSENTFLAEDMPSVSVHIMATLHILHSFRVLFICFLENDCCPQDAIKDVHGGGYYSMSGGEIRSAAHSEQTSTTMEYRTHHHSSFCCHDPNINNTVIYKTAAVGTMFQLWRIWNFFQGRCSLGVVHGWFRPWCACVCTLTHSRISTKDSGC